MLEWRNNSRKNEEMESKQKQYQLWMRLVMEVNSNAKDSEVFVAGHLGTGQNSDCQPGMGKAPTAPVSEADYFFPGC